MSQDTSRGAEIILPETVTPARVERIYRRAKELGEGPFPFTGMAANGLRAAKRRDPRLLYALERCAECIDKMAEDQSGQTRRQETRMRTDWASTRNPTEVNFFREAFLAAAERNEVPDAFGYLYAAVAEFAGLIV